MLKKYTLLPLLLCLFFLSANAQHKSALPLHKRLHTPRSVGDTLFYMSLPMIDFVNPIDLAGFNWYTEDDDSNMPADGSGPTSDFTVYYATDSSLNSLGQPTQNNFYHPWETPARPDTSYFWGVTSAFTPPGAADDWMTFGPLTIPAGGATLMWYDRTKDNRDGYQVLIADGTTGTLTPSDFVDPPLYSRADSPSPSSTYATDTTWQLRTATIPPSWNGRQVEFAFHHNALNMSYLFIDEITLVESLTNACTAYFTPVQDTANPLNYTIYSYASVGGSYSYLWDFGDSSTSTLQYPTHAYAGTGPYYLCLTVADGSGCLQTYCDSLHAGRSTSGITISVTGPLTTGLQEAGKESTCSVYPNPLSDAATVDYEIATATAVEISVFDLAGKKVATLESGNRDAGKHSISWNAGNLDKGMYLLRFQTKQGVSTKKLAIGR